MEKNTIITIGRQFGSGGREIGQKLAERLGIPFYDKELIVLASEKSGMSQSVLEGADEQPTNVFLQTCSTMSYTAGGRIALPTEISINDKLFFAQADVIQSIATQGSCVIVGRCADYILRETANCIHVFIHADLDRRVARVAALYDLPPEKAKNTIIKTDKRRANYYNYYTNKEWNHAESYDLCINSACLGIDGTVEAILDFAGRQ